MDPATAAIIVGVGGLTSLFGSWLEGNISERQFDREMEFMQDKLDRQMALEAKRLNLSEKQVRQQWVQFMEGLKQRKEEFAQTFSLQKEGLELQKEQVKHQKFMDIFKPIIDRKRRSRNLLTAFSSIARRPAAPVNPLTGTAAPRPAAGPVNPLTTPPTAPTGPTNPLTTGVPSAA